MSDYGQTTPADIGGSLDYDPSSSIYDPGTWSGIFDQAINSIDTQISGGTGGDSTPIDWGAATAQRNMGSTIDFGAGSTQTYGVAPGVSGGDTGGSWFDAALKWFDDDKSGLKGASTVSLAGSFIKGIFGSMAAQKQSKNDKRLLDIRERDSQNTMDVANQKFANAGSIAQTNFGAAPTGLIYSNKLEPRQKRAGYTGVA